MALLFDSNKSGFCQQTALTLASISALAYVSDNAEVKRLLVENGYTETTFCDFKSKDTQYLITECDSYIVIAFRGSEAKWKDWFDTNVDLFSHEIPGVRPSLEFSCHGGFLDAIGWTPDPVPLDAPITIIQK